MIFDDDLNKADLLKNSILKPESLLNNLGKQVNLIEQLRRIPFVIQLVLFSSFCIFQVVSIWFIFLKEIVKRIVGIKIKKLPNIFF